MCVLYRQEYIIDSTLLNYSLISLKKFNYYHDTLARNSNIVIKLVSNDHIYTFTDCHIDNTSGCRLYLPFEILSWIKNMYPFSVAYFSDSANEGIWKKSDLAKYFAARKQHEIQKMDVPAETIMLSFESDANNNYFLKIELGFHITTENATDYLSAKALSSILPYIFSSVQNTSIAVRSTGSSKCYIIDKTTNWLSVKEYDNILFSHPGLYLLRRSTSTGFAYYVGKANDIKARIKTNRDTLSHPDEKGEDDKQYDSIACISINFDALKRLYGTLDERNCTEKYNPPVSRGSTTDNALYAIEDIAIHAVAMILKSEGKVLDNKQYRSYTSEWIGSSII